MDKLAEICAAKREEVSARKQATSQGDLEIRASVQSPPRGFRHALESRTYAGFALIAEIKKASPSKGLIREDFEPSEHARAYAVGGATCLSVLTDERFFQGHEDYLIEARAVCSLPILRKDFILDPWQVIESRGMGADAVLLIIAALEDSALAEIEAAAIEQGMDVLVEVHDEAEMERAGKLKSRLIGINNRDLKTFETNLATTERLAPLAPEGALLVSESGINTHADLERLDKSGVKCFLVGESLMRQDDLAGATRTLLHG
jgi:indole-3-glycerol phosphate synthase